MNRFVARLNERFTHPDDRELMRKCFELAVALADEFKFCLLVVEHKRRPHPGGALGLCYVQLGRIAILVRYREGKQWWSRRANSDATVFDTVVHEVAHLPGRLGTPGLGDNAAHRELVGRMTSWARERGLLETCPHNICKSAA